ncbi:hypothetical protein GWK47_041631 [Chionoecetes opilio]|uniref:Kazal-like domain-containing protein n=1 Tax=Chionoecetes opilio TaxID=41210 RepID=A0A8J4YIV2_CHIOP|nr:hypothetical protein GWK47_041631 [Chionoecetes opilio]
MLLPDLPQWLPYSPYPSIPLTLAYPLRPYSNSPCHFPPVAALPRGPDCDVRCDRTYEPVCGTDGETYTNQCLMEHADCLNPFGSITAASDGPCGGLVSGAPSGPSASSSEESEERDESTSLARSPDTSFVLAV